MMSGLLFSGCSNPSCMWHGLTIDLSPDGSCWECAERDGRIVQPPLFEDRPRVRDLRR